MSKLHIDYKILPFVILYDTSDFVRYSSYDFRKVSNCSLIIAYYVVRDSGCRRVCNRLKRRLVIAKVTQVHQ